MKGFSLLETMLCIAMIAILSCIALPFYQNIIEHYDAEVTMKQLMRAIHLARIEAINKQTLVKLSANHDNWSNGYYISIDHHIVHRFAAIKQGATLSWKGFPAYPYLQFTAQGFTYYQNGSFSYFSRQGELLKKLIINQAGRVKIE